MKKYIFSFRAIGISSETRNGAYDNTGLWTVRAEDIDQAIDKADHHFKKNAQFRFEYDYRGSDHDTHR